MFDPNTVASSGRGRLDQGKNARDVALTFSTVTGHRAGGGWFLHLEKASSERRSHCLAASMLDFAWLDALPREANRPCLFLAEGVFPYLEESEVRRQVLALKSRFPGAELAFDATDSFFVWVHKLELSRKKMRARLHFGLKNGRQMENWAPGIRLLDEWFYFDQPAARLGGINLLRHFPPLGKASAIRRYQLGERQEL